MWGLGPGPGGPPPPAALRGLARDPSLPGLSCPVGTSPSLHPQTLRLAGSSRLCSEREGLRGERTGGSDTDPARRCAPAGTSGPSPVPSPQPGSSLPPEPSVRTAQSQGRIPRGRGAWAAGGRQPLSATPVLVAQSPALQFSVGHGHCCWLCGVAGKRAAWRALDPRPPASGLSLLLCPSGSAARGPCRLRCKATPGRRARAAQAQGSLGPVSKPLGSAARRGLRVCPSNVGQSQKGQAR